jgi:hypothetical protein
MHVSYSNSFEVLDLQPGKTRNLWSFGRCGWMVLGISGYNYLLIVVIILLCQHRKLHILGHMIIPVCAWWCEDVTCGSGRLCPISSQWANDLDCRGSVDIVTINKSHLQAILKTFEVSTHSIKWHCNIV